MLISLPKGKIKSVIEGCLEKMCERVSYDFTTDISPGHEPMQSNSCDVIRGCKRAIRRPPQV
jgi:hypothetical protein